MIMSTLIMIYTVNDIRSLRTIFDWAEDRNVFNVEATKVRAEFDANKHYPAGLALPSLKLRISCITYVYILLYRLGYNG